jgi:hypothetical protein
LEAAGGGVAGRDGTEAAGAGAAEVASGPREESPQPATASATAALASAKAAMEGYVARLIMSLPLIIDRTTNARQPDEPYGSQPHTFCQIQRNGSRSKA